MPTELLTTVEEIDYEVSKHFSPGQKVNLILGIPKDLTASELSTFQATLEQNGAKLFSPVEIGSTNEWDNALQVQLAAPDYSGVGVLPLVVLLILALGAVGVVAYLGVKIGSITDAIAKYIPIIILSAAGVFILYAVATKKAPYQG